MKSEKNKDSVKRRDPQVSQAVPLDLLHGVVVERFRRHGRGSQRLERRHRQGIRSIKYRGNSFVVIGVVVVAVGFVLGGIKFMKDDMQGSKDIIVKCFVAGAVVAMAPTIVKFIVGAFKLDDLTSGLK